MAVEVITIETASLGDRSYLAHDGSAAFVVDPQRDIDRVLAVAESAEVRITHVFETHIHNDYVTGGLALSRRTGAEYIGARADDVSFDRRAVEPGDRVQVGAVSVEAVATPGHTRHHLSYVARAGDHPVAVFTGGSMLYGAVGRTDLLGAEVADMLSRRQWTSVRGLANSLPDEVAVYPTHGFGSFCSSAPAVETGGGRVGDERDRNPALTIDDADDFVEYLLAGSTDFPSYYAHMALLNRTGPFEPDLTPAASLDPVELRRRLEAREWVVDVRDRRAFAGSHLVGSIGMELSDSFSTYLGWLAPWGSRITLIGSSPEPMAEAQRQLVRIGIDRPSGVRSGPVPDLAGDHPVASYPVGDFEELSRRRRADSDVEVVDVRRQDEHEEVHIVGAHHLPIHQVLDHLHHLPEGELWVHCASGARASVAASLLQRAGHRVVLVDDDMEAAAKAALLSP